MNKIYSLILLLIPFFNYSQTPCVNNKAGNVPCENYDLQYRDHAKFSNLPGNDNWGWVDPLDNTEYAISCFRDKTVFLDISDPVNPLYIGYILSSGSNGIWRDVKIYKTHAFIVADGSGAHGMQVFDLTRLRNHSGPPKKFNPDKILRAGELGITIGSCHNIVINEAKPMAYLVGCGGGGGPIMVDISNPTSPVILGQYKGDGYSHDAQVVTYKGPDKEHVGKEIYIGSNGSKTAIVDVTNPRQPKRLATATYDNTKYNHQGWFDKNHKYFYVDDEVDEPQLGNNTRTIIMDLTDLDNPKYHSSIYGLTKAVDHNLYIKGDRMYQANTGAGLVVYDIADVNNIKRLGSFGSDASGNAHVVNTWSVYPFFPSGNITLSGHIGFAVVRGTGPALNVEENTQHSISSFSIHPNPVSDNLIVSSKTEKIQSIALHNVLGKKIFEKRGNSLAEHKINVSNLSEGFYFVKINNLYTKKILMKK